MRRGYHDLLEANEAVVAKNMTQISTPGHIGPVFLGTAPQEKTRSAASFNLLNQYEQLHYLAA